MKKLIFILTFSISLSLFGINVYADEHQPAYGNGWYITVYNGTYSATHCYINFTEWLYELDPNNITRSNTFNYIGYYSTPFTSQDYNSCVVYIQEHYADLFYSDTLTNSGSVPSTALYSVGIPFRIPPSESGEYYLTYSDAFENNPPEPGDSWFDDMWVYFTDLLGLTDDFSDTLKDWIFDIGDGTGGHSGGHSFDIITPSLTPSPTPFPSPTPYDVTINYPDGTTGTITGIPSNTVIINGGDSNTNNYGSDFDIFEVDLKIGDGNSVNPRDGLNSVMDSNNEALKDYDTSSVSASFSLIPSDWFLLIGILGAFPIIAGFISKLLK